jgi:hypothetical protein
MKYINIGELVVKKHVRRQDKEPKQIMASKPKKKSLEAYWAAP